MSSRMVIRISAVLLSASAAMPALGGPNDTVWTKLWTGNNLGDWDIKFAGSALGTNLNNTFRAADGNLEVNYSGWTSFSNQFGHAGYKLRQFSFYVLRAEFQHWGTRPTGAPGWAHQNNGLMIHSQSAASMGPNQDFPVSLETQLLGSGNTESDNNSTLNLCTPGTAFYTQATGGTRNDSHCYSASTNTRVGPETWAWATLVVYGDSIIKHYNGPSVTGTPTLTYYRPVRATNSGAGGVTINVVNNERLTQGYILIQAETHPYRFRTIDVADMVGCMTQSSPSYKSYYVRHDAAACTPSPVRSRGALPTDPLAFDARNRSLFVNVDGAYSLKLADLSGRTVWEGRGTGEAGFDLRAVDRSGVYLLSMSHAGGIHRQRILLDG